jgi:hypothetical protein
MEWFVEGECIIPSPVFVLFTQTDANMFFA